MLAHDASERAGADVAEDGGVEDLGGDVAADGDGAPLGPLRQGVDVAVAPGREDAARGGAEGAVEEGGAVLQPTLGACRCRESTRSSGMTSTILRSLGTAAYACMHGFHGQARMHANNQHDVRQG